MGQNNNRNKKRMNYFENQIQRFGPEFLSRMTPLDMKKDANKILKDIVYGNIDYRVHTRFFTNINLVNNLALAAYDNYWYNRITREGLEIGMESSQPNPNVDYPRYLQHVSNVHYDAEHAFSILCTAMNNITNIIQMNPNNPNLTQITDELKMAYSRGSAYRDGMNFTFIVIDN